MRVISRVGAVAVMAATAAGLMLSGTLPAVAAAAVPAPSNFLVGPQASRSGCEVALLSARVYATGPAAVAAEVLSKHPGHDCTGWVERSPASGATRWTVASAKVLLPSGRSLEGIANTGLVSDGPGFKARACVRALTLGPVACTSAVSVAKGSGTATSPALAATYFQRQAVVFRDGSGALAGACLGLLAGNTTSKQRGTSVLAALASEGSSCTGWIQVTANSGHTWVTVSPAVSYLSKGSNTDIIAFSAHYADGPGHLARVCVKDMTSKKQSCSRGW